MREITVSAGERELKGTNLELIQRYFGDLHKDEYNIVTFETWINCNTVSDYKKTGSNE